MSTFADKLNALCIAEARDAIGDPDASSRMTMDLATELANAIAVLSHGDKAVARQLTGHLTQGLAAMVFKKAALVREGRASRGARS